MQPWVLPLCGPFPSFGPFHPQWVGAVTPPVRLELLVSLTGKTTLAEYGKGMKLAAQDMPGAGI